MKYTVTLIAYMAIIQLHAQDIQNNIGSNHANKFEQLGTILPTPNECRTASGAPGNRYWQQQCNYNIKCTLDEKKLKLIGSETITYINNSPDALTYLWLQLDENQVSSINNANYQVSETLPDNGLPESFLEKISERASDNKYGCNIIKVTDVIGKALKYTINKTMMRLELPTILKSGARFVFKIDWNYNISDRMKYGGRGGYEYFATDDNYVFTMTQWYPRLCVYSDFQGWQNHQFTGRGEFALTFGNFKVQMTVPANYVIGGTGVCTNYEQVLNHTQKKRWELAQTANEPVEITTLSEAQKSEANKTKATQTWTFKADSVRDFAWAASPKFIWDAMAIHIDNKKIMCMSFYPKEAYVLYRKFSTKVVAHTIKTYSHFTIPYPYPVAQSVEAANGMEYPMICFNYGRTEKDGTYSEATKNGMIGVITHEVGHNFFPMIVNSDERQWTWMDEGLNTFVEYLTEELFDNRFPTRRGAAYSIVDYMKLPKNELEPIMTNSENIVRFGANAYAKTATGLNILRETIMGREMFDYAFKQYAQRWAFKHPTPADFFRTMGDASAENLDWFWRGWFYNTNTCDIALDSMKHIVVDTNFVVDNTVLPSNNTVKIAPPILPAYDDISKIRNRTDTSITFLTDADTSLRDFYWRYDRGIEPYDSTTAMPSVLLPKKTVPETESKIKFANKHLYELYFSNKGGLVMPIIVQFIFDDGSNEVYRIPAQVWRYNETNVTKVFMTDKSVTSIQLDPYYETADIDKTNNTLPRVTEPTKLMLFKAKMRTARGQSTGMNPMQTKQ